MKSADFKIDKSNWVKVSFGEVVREVREVSKNPLSEGLERLIGLEHIVSENIHIKNWGFIKDGTTFNHKFSKGQVLFGRRRAYLKKVAVADFDGICSGDITVMEAKDGLLPELLPFIVQNEKFFDYAVKNSAGSLSPRVKFKDLANYKFLLPPKNQQVKIAELLWAEENIIESYNKISSKLDAYYQSYIEHFFNEKNGWAKVKLDKISYINQQSLKPDTNMNYEFKYLDIASIVAPKQIGALQKYKFVDAPLRARRIVSNGSIILSLVRPYLKSFVLIDGSDHLIASTGTCVIDTKDKVNNLFVFHQFFTKRFMKYCEDKMSGTNYPAITPSDIKEYEIVLPQSYKEQLAITNRLNQIDYSTRNLIETILVLNNFKKLLVKKILS